MVSIEKDVGDIEVVSKFFFSIGKNSFGIRRVWYWLFEFFDKFIFGIIFYIFKDEGV